MRERLSELWKVYRWTLDLLFPPSCVGCQKLETWLCDACAQQIPLHLEPLCPRCGRPWNGVCVICRSTPLRVAPIHSVFLFQGLVRDVLHAFKYRGARNIVSVLQASMLKAWRYHEVQSDLLVPVPLHAQREKRRGYNQAAVLAQALSYSLQKPAALQLLTRVRNTPSQTRLSREERQANVREAFVALPFTSLEGKIVTLVDDVATTGATLDACAAVLLECGARSVNAFTLARAP